MNQKTFSSSWDLNEGLNDCPPTATPALSRQVTSGLSPSWKMSLELWWIDASNALAWMAVGQREQ